jgi:Cullin family/Cullin protein neddylation domain
MPRGGGRAPAVPLHRTKAAATATSGGSGGGAKKIVIRPYQKPPQLPSNYYEETAETILKGCLAVLHARLGTKSSAAAALVHSSSLSSTQSPPQPLSLQNAYTATVHLVSHQYGARLYADVVATLQEAAICVLPQDMATSLLQQSHSTISAVNATGSASASSSDQATLLLLPSYIVQQYQAYADFVLLLQHVCLPLDRTWQWQWLQSPFDEAVRTTLSDTTFSSDSSTSRSSLLGRAVAIHSTSAATSTAAAAAAASVGSYNATSAPAAVSPSLQTLWHVGLSVFLSRLSALKLNTVLYEQWLAALLQDWNGYGLQAYTMCDNGPSSGGGDDLSVRHCLQHVWYLWQDLRIMGQLPLQRDLEVYWSKVSNDWKTTVHGTSSGSSTAYPLTAFLHFCHAKLQHCHYWRPWLPAPWLWNILDVHLVQPHLNTDYLLSDAHLFPVLTEQILVQKQALQGRRLDHWNATATPNAAGGNPHNSKYNQVKSISDSATQSLNPIQQLWILAGRLPGGQTLVGQAIQRFARQQGLQRVGAPSTSDTTTVQRSVGPPTSNVVEDLLLLQDCLSSMIDQLPGASAPNESGTTNGSIISLKSVWEEVVNVETTPSLAEQLAKFLDATLRNNKKMEVFQSQSDSSLEYGWLQRIISGLFIPLQAKDLFEAFYKRDLAKRLLWNRVVSVEAEKQVCSLLKAECGTGYTSKIEGMFQDVEWSRETMLVYKQSTGRTHSNSSVEVEVQVLTTGYWPVYPIYPNLQLPDDLREQKDQFDNHYKNKYQGRRMTWQYALGHCMVKANGFPKAYELLVSLCQAMVLIQFTTSDTVFTLPLLLSVTGLEDRDEMERILQSLSLGKDGTRILRKMDYDAEPGKKKKIRMTVDDKDKFVINSSFESNVRRVRINNIMMKETKEEHDKTVEAVSRDRLYLIDAVLVRIMKARKSILHQALIPQVLEQVKVPAQTADIKKRIESLIEREYMERDAKDRNRYNYLA